MPVPTVRRSMLTAFAVAALLMSSIVRAEGDPGVEPFYRDHVLSLYIGFSVGGGYDVYGRLVARHIGKHLPGNPTVVPINMDGAGSLKMANWLYNAAPRDGSAIGIFSRGVPFEPLLGNANLARFDATKFVWIGSTTNEVSVCATFARTGITRFEQLYERELIVGSTGSGADTDVFPRIIAGVLGAKFRIVSGYPGSNDIDFAIERGEVDGRCGWSWSSIMATKRHLLEDGTLQVLLQLALHKHPDLPDVPLVTELARNEDDLRILRLVFVRGTLGRPFVAPPGIPPARAAALRKAFDDMVADPEFLAEAERARLEITPISGAELEELIEEVYATPAPLVERTRRMLQR
jgi:tripartite-type tricarboxylate transporter receptor subunit TctC